jgi:hypothetical protein
LDLVTDGTMRLENVRLTILCIATYLKGHVLRVL